MAILYEGNTAERWKRLGDMLLGAGLITRGQLEEGLAEKEHLKCFLGQALVKLGYISQEELISFLVKQCKIPHINLVDYRIDPRCVQYLPNHLCLQYKILAIDKLGSILTIAMVNPLDIEALEQARAACPTLKLKPILCTPEHFELVAKRLLLGGGRPEGSGAAATMDLSTLGLHALKPKKAAPPPPREEAPEAPAPAKPPATAAPEDYSVLVREILGELLSTFEGPPRDGSDLLPGPFSNVYAEDLQFYFTLGASGEPCYVSSNVRKILGYSAGVFKEHFLDLLTDHPANPVLRRAITLSCAGQQHAPVEAEFVSVGGNPRMLYIALIPVFDGRQALVAVQGVARDVSRREKTEAQIFHAANHDRLTGLLNRRSFMERLSDVVQLARRHRIPVSVGVINLDGFTQLNQEFGHAEGNAVLAGVGQLLRTTFRGEDGVARSGSDEFYIFMPHVPPEEARNGLSRCRELLANTVFTTTDGRRITVTMTAALVSLSESGGSPAHLVEIARSRVLAAKSAGGDRVVSG